MLPLHLRWLWQLLDSPRLGLSGSFPQRRWLLDLEQTEQVSEKSAGIVLAPSGCRDLHMIDTNDVHERNLAAYSSLRPDTAAHLLGRGCSTVATATS